MCLLKPGISDTADQSLRQFTFHYVSIKTKIPAPVYFVLYKFTFHHVSIKTIRKLHNVTQQEYSHSTMYLLKLYNAGATAVTGMNSHSTMYLLKLVGWRQVIGSQPNSHSTMYLLKHMPYNVLRLPHSNSHSTMYLLKQLPDTSSART